MNRATVLIPAYNAEETLSELIVGIEQYVPRSKILVVDDGSTDRTADIATRSGVKLLRHGKNHGKGRALRTGFEYILNSTECQSVVTMDADLQHLPREIPSFFAIRDLEQAHVVVGHRPRWGTNMPLPRKFSNTITSALVSARTSTTIRDSQCGYRLIARSVLESVRTSCDGYEAETEFLIKAARQGYRIAFVPIQTVYANEATYMTNVNTTIRFLKILLKEY
jgi:glycosyltransferase involved in cell wall biosynthesis